MTILVDFPIQFLGESAYSIEYAEPVDIDFIDLILISNVPSATGIPYLAGRFRGRILMTKPVSKLAKAYCEELVTLDEISGSRGRASNLYSAADVEEIWGCVDSMAYTQRY